MRYAIDPTKIHNELGWLPETKFEDGIKKTIQWYLDNKEWWETIISGEYQNYYEKMYSTLFNAITDALEQIEQQNFGSAKDLLIAAQQQAEEIYITAEN